jgi:hypothetical protein
MSNPPKIYFDEAGNTGPNLVDPDQPMYSLLSVCMPDEQAMQLLELISSNAAELHFKKLKKYRSSQLQILELLNQPSITSDTVKYSISHKEYCIVAHIVDRLIEPVLYDMNHDGYSSGLNKYFANFLYLLGKYEWGQQRLDRLTSAFHSMARNKSPLLVEQFYQIVLDEVTRASSSEKAVLQLLMNSRSVAQDILNRMLRFDTDLSLPSFTTLVDQWGRQLNGRFEVIHDNSKQIEFWKEHIAFLSSRDIKPTEVGYAEMTMRYPYMIQSLELADSRTAPQLQLADILVSAVNYSITTASIRQENDQFAQEILESKLLQLPLHMIWPSTDYQEPTMEGRPGKNMLDYLVRLAEKHPDAYKKATDSTKHKPQH